MLTGDPETNCCQTTAHQVRFIPTFEGIEKCAKQVVINLLIAANAFSKNLDYKTRIIFRGLTLPPLILIGYLSIVLAGAGVAGSGLIWVIRGSLLKTRHKKRSQGARVLVLILALTNSVSSGAGLRDAAIASFASKPTGQQHISDIAVQLKASDQFERQIEPGDVHHYLMDLLANSYLRLTINDWDAYLTLTVFRPDGTKLCDIASLGRGPILSSVVAEPPGIYSLEIRASRDVTATGRYEIRIDSSPEPTVIEAALRAERSFADASRLHLQWRAEAFQQALTKYEEARNDWRVANDLRGQANALIAAGDVYLLLSENRQAIDRYQQALALYQSATDHQGEIDALNGLGYAYIDIGEPSRTVELCNQAYSLSQALTQRRTMAQALNNIGLAYYVIGDLEKALSFLNRALPIWQGLPDARGQAETLNNIGYSYYDLGQIQQALDYYSRALNFWRAANDPHGQAQALTALAGALTLKGERQDALDRHNQALELFTAMGDRNGQAATLNGIAFVYEDLAERTTALDFYSRALALYQASANKGYEELTLSYIARVYESLGQVQKALDYYRQLLSLRRAAKDLRLEAYTLNDLGVAYHSLGQSALALNYFEQSLAQGRKVGDRRAQAYSLNNLASAYESRAEMGKALDYYRQALALFRLIEDRSGEVLALYNLAAIESRQGKLEDARALIEDSLNLIEWLRAKVSSRQLRATSFASARQHYELYADLLMRLHQQHPDQGFDALAVEACERAHARSLLDTLHELRASPQRVSQPALLERERALQAMLDSKAERRMQLLNGGAEAAQIAPLAQEIRLLIAQLQEVRARIRAADPRYAALVQPQPLKVPQIQAQVLDSDSLLLEYLLGDEHSYLWVISQSSLTSYVLPKGKEIEKTAHDLYQALTARQRKGGTAGQYQTRANDARYWLNVRRLSDMLLKPAGATLGTKRLLIVADGVLQYIPFAALPEPGDRPASPATSNHSTETPPLIALHEIVNLPSASALAESRQQRQHDTAQRQMIAVFADPVFDKDDPRISASALNLKSARQRPLSSDLRQTLRETIPEDPAGIPRLRSSRREAEAILAIAPAQRCQAFLNFDANRVQVMSTDLSKFGIIHFATHALLDNEHPELSGIVLSLVDEKGQPQNGYLRMHEIYDLHLAADLIVLSACNTALGKDIKGEGLVGLTRGFMYAGAKGVIASLWKVDDLGTANLMQRFYTAMLRQGLPPVAALRKAQLSMWQQTRWKAPFYWAAFSLHGEWR